MLLFLVICLVSFLGSGLTLFSGFGLGTLLVPVFGLFFPIEVAISLTAIVHFLNNLFKVGLLGKKANLSIVIKFGIPSVIAAFIGALVLSKLSNLPVMYQYELFSKTIEVSAVKLIIAVLIAVFSFIELIPKLNTIEFGPKYLIPGGFISGFFGGLSGNQGALRTAFLVKSGLTKESFIATGVLIACLVDITRLSVYSGNLLNATLATNSLLLVAATLSAFCGAYFGNRLLKKITIRSLQKVVAVALLIFALLLGMGIL